MAKSSKGMLIIGRRKPYKGDEFGGAVILYELFLQYLRNNNIKFKDIDLNWRNYSHKFHFLLVIYLLVARQILLGKEIKISFHGTTTDFIYYAPFVVLMSKIRKKRVTLRKFGGSFDLYYQNLSWGKRKLLNFTLKNADCVFFETKHLVSNFSWLQNTIWFPNVRNKKVRKNSKDGFQKRFVFISHVKESKGINLILETVVQLPDHYKIDLYGPKKNYTPPSHLTDVFEECYKGVLEPHEVNGILAAYDVLLLPTFHEGEGYPGIIIEAYSQGVPVITTKWRAIPEIVKDGETGYLIKPKSEKALIEAVMRFNAENHSKFSDMCIKYFENFDQDKIMERVVKYL